MPSDISVVTVIAASTMLLLASVVRAVRLYISLGLLRPRFLSVCTMHFLGTVLGYLSGAAFVYELVIIVGCSFKKATKAIPTLVSLMIVRGLDAVIILVMALSMASVSQMQTLIFFLILLIVLIWFGINSIIPVLKRVERNLLETSARIKSDVKVIALSHNLRINLGKLPWEKKGTIAMMVVLSMMAWLLEWAAVYLLVHSAMDAVAIVVDRVGGSVGMAMDHVQTGAAVYSWLMPSVYMGLILCLVVGGFRLLRRKNRSSHS